MADDLQDASALIKQEKFPQALTLLDKSLAQKPADPQARFLKGIALTEMGKTDAAIATFQKLTEDYPTLPEPYNNLAVIFAQQKQYDKAKSALEMAIRTHPAYATAHENLGDVYARLASQAYDKALQIDSSNASAQHKLALIHDLTGTPARIARPATGDSAKPGQIAVTPPANKPIPPVTVALAPVRTAPANTASAKPATPEIGKPAEKPATGATTNPQPAQAVKTPAGHDNGSETRAIEAAVENWAAAWARKDVKAYLAAYAREFKVPGGKSRSAWENDRRVRIDKPGDIVIGIAKLKVALNGDTGVASFRQSYRSGHLDVTTSKRLDMAKRDGRWQIVAESVGN